MSTSRRVIFFGIIGCVGLLVFGVTAAILLVNTGDYKAQLEGVASRALGMEVGIGGSLGVALFPGVRVTLNDVHLRNRGADIVLAKQVRLAIDLLPLLRKEVRVAKIELRSPTFSLEKDHRGHFNFEKQGAATQTPTTLDLPSVSVSNATLVYADQQSASAIQAADCSLDLHGLRLSGGTSSNLLRDLSFTAELGCGEVRSDGLTLFEVKSSAEAKSGVLDVKPLTMRVFGTQGSGSIRADFSGAVASYQLHCSLLQFSIEEFFKTLSLKKFAVGRMDFSANLSMQGTTTKGIRQTMKGHVSLRGKNLTLMGSDLDRQLSRFESSQNFNIVDVGAVFFAGPLGLLVTKGYNFASIFQDTGTRSELSSVVSDWKVERGVAQAEDVAMATKENRIALQGGLDFVNRRFNDVTVALIDSKGCAKLQQKIRGDFDNPVVDKASLLTSITGPALRLLEKGRDLFLGQRCSVFYAGSVIAPK